MLISLFSKTEGMAHQEKSRLTHGMNTWKKIYNYLLGKSKDSRSQSKGDLMIFRAEKLEKLVYEIRDLETKCFNKLVFIKK